MIIFSLIEYYGVKVFVLSYFFNPFMFFEWELVINSFFIFCCYFFFTFNSSSYLTGSTLCLHKVKLFP
jgi:hypothetical protein